MNIGDLNITNFMVGDTQVDKLCLGTDVVWPTIDYSQIPLTFDVKRGGTINWVSNSTAITRSLYYSKDNGDNWTLITSSTGGTEIPVNAGDKVMFRANNPYYTVLNGNLPRTVSFSGSTAGFNLYGNIMSLTNSTDFSASTSVSAYAFFNMFQFCTGLTSAENLVLPATTLSDKCYSGMFQYCNNLTTAPVLPAQNTAWACYQMMFFEATKLKHIKCLALNRVENDTPEWVSGIVSTGTFVKHPNATWTTGYNGIPANWTVQDAEL